MAKIASQGRNDEINYGGGKVEAGRNYSSMAKFRKSDPMAHTLGMDKRPTTHELSMRGTGYATSENRQTRLADLTLKVKEMLRGTPSRESSLSKRDHNQSVATNPYQSDDVGNFQK